MIKLEDVYFAYGKHRQVLNNINLSIKKGFIYGLLGKNGEGKTTLINIMSGLLFPQKGKCIVLDENPSKRTAEFLRQIFLLPEEGILPDVKVSDYFRMYSPLYPTYNHEIQEKCLEAFEIKASDSIQKMSFGQKKKVSITMALSAQTPILFMDEPTNGLDVPSKTTLRKLLAYFTTEEQTIIISTHQMRELESLINAVIILDNKEIIFDKTIEEISSKLDFRRIENDEQAIYSEIFPGGTMGVVKNETGEKSGVPLELLFNMAITQKEKTKILLSE